MISPRRAPVRPHVISCETGETVLLEELVDSCAGHGHYHSVELVGGPRTGKTTALAHLASLPIADRLMLVDDAWPADLPLGMSGRLVVYTARSPLDVCDLSYELAAWCGDDLIEYLLSTHPDRCSSVMARFTADGSKSLLDGKPELLCIVAEQMAADESVSDRRTALRRGIAERVRDEQTHQLARLYSAAALLGMQQLAEERALEIKQRGVGDELFGPLSHRLVQLLLTADQAISTLQEGCEHPFPMRDLPRALVEEVAQLAKGDPAVLRRLQQLVVGGREYYAPMAASILHFADQRLASQLRLPHLSCGRLFLCGALAGDRSEPTEPGKCRSEPCRSARRQLNTGAVNQSIAKG